MDVSSTAVWNQDAFLRIYEDGHASLLLELALADAHNRRASDRAADRQYKTQSKLLSYGKGQPDFPSLPNLRFQTDLDVTMPHADDTSNSPQLPQLYRSTLLPWQFWPMSGYQLPQGSLVSGIRRCRAMSHQSSDRKLKQLAAVRLPVQQSHDIFINRRAS